MNYRKKALGFGFIPEESQHHFLVKIPRSTYENVVIYERFQWIDNEVNELQPLDYVNDIPKVEISKHKWKLIEEALRTEFNGRLKKEQTPVGKWRIGEVPVQRLFGKEMVLLAWAVEDSDPSVISTAIKNWHGLSPEERWWLFTMTNAATGYVSDKRGWRKAIRYALTENPIDENNKQMDLFDFAMNRQIR